MPAYGKIAIVVVLALVVGAALFAKQDRSAPTSEGASAAARTDAEPSEPTVPEDASVSQEKKERLPRLVDLGARKCIPCKMMAPILDELKKEYEGQMEVVFIDVWENRDAGEQYGIRSIPTQIFYDASGKERFRHEGFFSKEDILAKCDELGFDLKRK